MVIEKSTVEKKKENKFEFALFINDYKIIGRYFSADEYNPKIRNSVDIRHLADEIVEMIRTDLKKKDFDHIYADYDLLQKSGRSRQENRVRYKA